MHQIEALTGVRDLISDLRSQGQPIALVPTMGALHDGHLSLVHQAVADGGTVVATIFVNPTQFAAHEDLESYPSTLDQDLRSLADVGVKGVWTPRVSTMYPGLDATRVRLDGDLTKLWEGKFRPHFFEGVATVVAKLFIATLPDRAYFGEKDYQQLQVIRAMAEDLLLPTQVIGCPTVRADDGLALSSRNAYLSDTERMIAPMLNKAMQTMAQEIKDGAQADEAKETARQTLQKAGFGKVDYLDAVDATSLAPVGHLTDAADVRILAAAYVGSTRLIDNIAV